MPGASGRSAGPASPATRKRRAIAVRSLYRFLVAEGVLGVDPASAVEVPAVPTGLPKALTEEEVGRLLDAVVGHILSHPAPGARIAVHVDEARVPAYTIADDHPAIRAGRQALSSVYPDQEVLLAVKKAGGRVYPTNEAFAAAMKNEEIGISAIWKARVVQWQNAGIPCEAVSPVEGIPTYVSGFVIAKNAPNKANAYAYMDAMLAKAPQEAFAVDMGYNGTVSGLDIDPALQKRIGFTPEEEKTLKDLDYAFLAKNDAAMKEWWDKVFKG